MPAPHSEVVTIKVPFAVRKRGGRKLVLAPDGAPMPPAVPHIDRTLVKAIVRAFGWMPWLEPIDAKIAWLRASGTRWKEICWEVGLARAAAHEHWLYALCVIAWRLNGSERVQHIGRRRLIARTRSLA